MVQRKMAGDYSALLSKLEEWKASIKTVMQRAAEPLYEDFSRVHPLGPDVLHRIVDFSVQGKMVRGGLVCLAEGLVSGRVSSRTHVAGAAVEMFQSALLIHDDIMDRDLYRRGESSVYHRYAEESRVAGIGDAEHLGEGMGICAGDIAFFLGFV